MTDRSHPFFCSLSDVCANSALMPVLSVKGRLNRPTSLGADELGSGVTGSGGAGGLRSRENCLFARCLGQTKAPSRGAFAERLAEQMRNVLEADDAKSVVPGAGLEPAHLAAGDFESPASTDFATRARQLAAPGVGAAKARIMPWPRTLLRQSGPAGARRGHRPPADGPLALGGQCADD